MSTIKWLGLTCAGLAWACLGQALAQALEPPQVRQHAPTSEPSVDAAPRALSLEQAMELSLAQNFRMRRAERNVQSADWRVQDADAQRKPRLDLSLNLSDTLRNSRFVQQSNISVEPTENLFNANLTGTAYLQIDIAGTVKRQRRQAELFRDSARLNQDQTRRDLESEVRSSYTEALRSQENFLADEQSIDRLRQLIVRVPSDRVALRNYLELELASGLQALGASRNNLDLALGNLLQQLRLPAQTRLRLTSTLRPEVPFIDSAQVLELGLLNRTDLRDARLRLEQAELMLKQVGDHRKPNASVFAYSGSTQSIHQRNDQYNSRGTYSAVMFNLTVPLLFWDAGVMANSERSALLNLEQARDDQQELKERAEAELRQLTVSLQQARQRLQNLPSPELALSALTSAEAALLDSAQWESGLAQVTNARQLWRLASSARIDALSDFYMAFARLQRVMGDLNRSGN